MARCRTQSRRQPMSDINMTPLIDVMLVLLVIFMITAPLMTSSLKLDLPKTDAAQPSDTPQFISRRARPRRPSISTATRRSTRRPSPRASPPPPKKNPQTEVQLRADKAVPYGARRRADRHRPEGRADADRLHRRAPRSSGAARRPRLSSSAWRPDRRARDAVGARRRRALLVAGRRAPLAHRDVGAGAVFTRSRRAAVVAGRGLGSSAAERRARRRRGQKRA